MIVPVFLIAEDVIVGPTELEDFPSFDLKNMHTNPEHTTRSMNEDNTIIAIILPFSFCDLWFEIFAVRGYWWPPIPLGPDDSSTEGGGEGSPAWCSWILSKSISMLIWRT